MKKMVSSIILVVAIASMMLVSALQDPYPLDGYVVDELGAPVMDANVTFTNQNTGEVICYDTGYTGWYTNDAGNFPSGYQDGHTIKYDVKYSDCSTTIYHVVDSSAGFRTMNISVLTILDSDNDGVPDAWDEEHNPPENYLTDSCGRGRLFGDMNGDGKLSSVDALMILQMAVR